ncbi:MAG: hypothetical protein DLM54_09805 [Acidimicrobiales bacterium]|nr:MAG: hypothetical protein DLM54_09805 [Acidimicrobiales bacterium]
MSPDRIPPDANQESVWDYPRPPRVEPEPRPVRVVLGGVEIARSTGALRVLETSHPPVYYLPPSDIRPDALHEGGPGSWCEWKGAASYLDVAGGPLREERAAWRYDYPAKDYTDLAGFVAFYAQRMDQCFVGDELVVPQPGGFYGGWVTSWVVGPFKGVPGSAFW